MVTITIGGAEKSGALARVSALLVRKGYALKGQQLVDGPSGVKLVKVAIDAPQVDRAKLAAELRTLGPEFTLLGVEGAPSGAAAPSLKDIAAKFPDITSLVRAYGEAFAGDARERELFEAGKKIGAFQWEKDWSFGSPLKMPTALRRTLVPALEAVCKVEATDTEVGFPDSPLCSGQVACCGFLGGFMQGFLDAGPATANSRVEKVSCKTRGDSRCSFKIQYEL
jgi:predicted hydrocarbon binding protein